MEELSKERDEATRKCKEASKLAYAEVREQVPTLYLLTYAMNLCERMQTYANVCEQVPTLYRLTYAHVCSRMLTYADVC